MSSDMVLWEAARAAALAAAVVLGASLLTGMALRTALLAPLARNRAAPELGVLGWAVAGGLAVLALVRAAGAPAAGGRPRPVP